MGNIFIRREGNFYNDENNSFSKTTTMTGKNRGSDLFKHYRKIYYKEQTVGNESEEQVGSKQGRPLVLNRKGVSDHWSACSPFHINYASGADGSRESTSITGQILRLVKFMFVT